MASPLPALRRWWAHYRFLYWLLVVATAAVTAMAVDGATARAREERDRWGRSVVIAVAARAIESGRAVTAADVKMKPWPRALVPSGALVAVPSGAVAGAFIDEGEPIVGSRLAPAGAGPVASRAPVGSRAIAIPVGDEAIAVVVGDHADLLATYPGTEPGTSPAAVVARNVVVIGVEPRLITVGIAVVEAPDVARAVNEGSVVLAVIPAGRYDGRDQFSTVAASTSTTTPATTR
ncbi:MAG: SAF domain-containing protein [Acidimicrobiia bacterium]